MSLLTMKGDHVTCISDSLVTVTVYPNIAVGTAVVFGVCRACKAFLSPLGFNIALPVKVLMSPSCMCVSDKGRHVLCLLCSNLAGD